MAKNRIALTTLACIFLASPAIAAPRTQAQPLPRATAAAETLGEAKVLKAWAELCERLPSECQVDLTEPTAIILDQAHWNTVTTVNLKVNATVKGVNDSEHWVLDDRWDFAEDGKGDCEDYALLKRRTLAAAGFPRRAMRMTVVVNELDEGHAVLTLVTDRGDIVLDNRTNQVLPWGKTGYRFVKRESQDRTGWVYLGPGTGPDLTATRRLR